jgi:hypothetical protein
MAYQARDEVKFSNGSTAQRVAPVTVGGAAVNPAQEDGNLQRVASGTDYVVSAACRVAIDGTSRLVTALSGGPTSLPDDLIRIGLVREYGSTDQVRFSFGAAASAGAPQWPADGVASMPITAALARTMQVISSGGTVYAMLLVLTPRN